MFIPAKKIHYRISEENIENITKSDSKFTPTFVDHYLLPEIFFNEDCVVEINTYIPKK